MRNLYFILGVALALGLTACDKKELKLYPTFQESAIIDVDQNGTYSELGVINISEVNEEIDELDLDEDGQITDVMIEGIWAEIRVNAPTTATSTTANLLLEGWDGINYTIVENLQVDLTKQTQTMYFYNNLKRVGVKKLRDYMAQIVNNSQGAGNDEVRFRLQGTTVPQNGYINAEIEVFVKVALEFSTEIGGN